MSSTIKRLIIAMSIGCAAFAFASALLYVQHQVLATIGASLLAVVAAILLVAAVGLARDPSARSMVEQRVALRRGESVAPLPLAQDNPVAFFDHDAGTEVASEDVTQGFSVPANRAERRAAERAERRAKPARS